MGAGGETSEVSRPRINVIFNRKDFRGLSVRSVPEEIQISRGMQCRFINFSRKKLRGELPFYS